MQPHNTTSRSRAGQLLGAFLMAGLAVLAITNRCPAQSMRVKPFPPAYYVIPNGNNILMVCNPTNSSVRVRLRSFPWGRDFIVPAGGWRAISAPNAAYEVFFRFGNDPKNVYKGDPVRLFNSSARITLKQSTHGNYGLRQLP